MERTTAKQRTEAFSDGVFAVAATLLVVDVVVPRVESGRLLSALVSQWPAYATFAVSFMTIGIMWLNHHAIFDRLSVADRSLQLLNLVLLLLVALMPFPTATLAQYLQEGHDQRVAAALYGLVASLMGMAFTALYLYVARREHLLVDRRHGSAMRRSILRFALGSLVYPAAMLVSLVNAYAALAVYAALAAYYAFTPLPGAVAEVQGSELDEPSPGRTGG